MGKQKQQVISRFFAPKSNQTTASSSASSPPPPLPPPQQTPPPKIAATVSFSPAKRKVVSSLFPPKTPKKPKLFPHTLNPIPTPSSQTTHNKKYTPLEQQVVELKTKYPDVLLMIEVGYKFRFFGEDAEMAAKVLGIYAHLDHNFMTASIPTFRLNVHVRRLVNAGFKVGVVKQTETAAIKAHGPGKAGPFGRGLSALYTKATLEAAEDVGGGEDGCGGESNYLVCVVDDDGNVGKIRNGVFGDGFDVRLGVVAVEISTGDVVYGEFNDGFLRSGLEAVLLSLSPAELLLGQPLSKQTEKMLLVYAGPASNVRVECASRDCFIGGGALAEVMSLYENMGEDTLSNNEDQNMDVPEQGNHRSAIEGIMNMPDLAVQALALTIRHLKQFGLERIMCLGASFRSLSGSMEMTLSANTLQQLEVLRNNSNGSEYGTLLHIMNHTLTIYGSRLLRRWVTHPLCDRNLISARLDAVSEIAESMGSYRTSESVGQHDEKNSDVTIVEPQFYYILSSVLTSLGRSPDIQRGITRIFHRTATPSEFIAVMQAILYAGKQLQQLHIDGEYREKVTSKTLHSALLKRLILTASSPAVIGKAAKLLSTVNKEAADQGDLLNLMIISNGQFSEVARARKAVQSAKEELDSLINMCRKQLGMRNLEFMSVSGITHLIELPANFKVPLNWAKVNSTKKTIRYHSPEVLTALDQLALANEELTIVCRAAWDSFLKEFGGYYAEFQAAVQALAALDCLHALATLSRNKNFVRPVFVDDHEPVQIHICSGRHPVLDTILLDNFVPNDTNLHAEREYCQIITGPNMGGKSCYIRQVALIGIMAQVGSFVPASSAELHVLDGIYTRMGASDSIQQGRSTFLEELNEASYILRNCTAQSLVIVDELGRGTSTHDGVAIAYATLDYLLEHKKCMVLFVTHYPKIADIKTKFTGSVGTYHVSYLTSHKVMGPMDSKSDQDVTYLYKVVPGVSESSFGFKVAQLAQLPPSCISRATVIAAKLEAEVSSRVQNRSAKRDLLVKLSDQEQEAQENMPVSPESFYLGRVEASEDLISAYRDLFLNLKFATHDDNPAKSFQFLKHARSIAKELIIR